MKKNICILLIIINTILGFGQLSFASDYILAPSDQLEIKIISQKDLDTKQIVAPDGTISLPLLGRVTAQGKTLDNFNKYLSDEFSQYIKNPQVVVYLTPRPIYIVQHDVRKNVWDVKEAKSINEAKALAGRSYVGEIKHGDVIPVEVSNKPDFFEDNWYKVITATAVIAGIYSTMHK